MRFEAFECIFQYWKGILTIQMLNSYYSNEIRNIWMQILTIQKEFDTFECKF